MGGRGTFAKDNNVAYTYKTVGKIEGVKVLQGLNGKHNLPEEAHSSFSYIMLYPDGNFKQIRTYDANHNALYDIDYHPEFKLSRHRNSVYHIHYYHNGIRGKGNLLNSNDKEYRENKKYFKGIKK